MLTALLVVAASIVFRAEIQLQCDRTPLAMRAASDPNDDCQGASTADRDLITAYDELFGNSSDPAAMMPLPFLNQLQQCRMYGRWSWKHDWPWTSFQKRRVYAWCAARAITLQAPVGGQNFLHSNGCAQCHVLVSLPFDAAGNDTNWLRVRVRAVRLNTGFQRWNH